MVPRIESGSGGSTLARPEFARGMQLHADGAYYDAHEAWESLWIDEPDGDLRVFLQGLIQVTSAFHKVFVQEQPQSAMRLLERGLSKLSALAEDYGGVALGDFRRAARRCETILSGGAELTPADVPKLRWIGESEPFV